MRGVIKFSEMSNQPFFFFFFLKSSTVIDIILKADIRC